MINNYKPKIPRYMDKYDVSEADLRADIDRIDSGELDDEELLAKSPVQLPAMKRFKKLNEEVKKQQILVDKLESMS